MIDLEKYYLEAIKQKEEEMLHPKIIAHSREWRHLESSLIHYKKMLEKIRKQKSEPNKTYIEDTL